MRGQAFLTFPSVEVAHRALVIILNNHLVLHKCLNTMIDKHSFYG